MEYAAPFLEQLIPTDCVTVEDASELALCLQRFSENEIQTYCAALSMEADGIRLSEFGLVRRLSRKSGRQ